MEVFPADILFEFLPDAFENQLGVLDFKIAAAAGVGGLVLTAEELDSIGGRRSRPSRNNLATGGPATHFHARPLKP